MALPELLQVLNREVVTHFSSFGVHTTQLATPASHIPDAQALQVAVPNGFEHVYVPSFPGYGPVVLQQCVPKLNAVQVTSYAHK